MPNYTVIVPVFQTPGILRLFLESLKDTLTQNTDIIFINDGSGTYVQSMLEAIQQQTFPSRCKVRITVLEHKVSCGTALSINAALARVNKNCDYVVLLDSDIMLQGDWQDKLIPVFDVPDIGAAGGLLLYPQSGGIQCCGLTYCENSGKHLYLNAFPDMLPMTNPFEVQATVFAFCCFRRDIIDQLGFLDEHFLTDMKIWIINFDCENWATAS